MKKTITYRELHAFDNFATAYLIKHGYFETAKDGKPPGYTTKEPTKFVTNLKNFLSKQVVKHFQEFNDLRDDLQLDFCSVDDKTKVILKGPNGERLFTVENEKKLKAALKELENKTIEIHVRITEGDWGLTDEEKEAFKGIVIPEFKPEETE